MRCGFLCGSVIGCLGCWAKLSRSYLLRWLADVYTTVLRGVPDLLVIYLFYFGSSMVLTQLAQSLGLKGFVGLPGFFVGVVAISVISGAYQLEVLRGAVNSVAIGSIEAGRSIGLSKFKLFSLIIAPQALRLALPGLGNVWLPVLGKQGPQLRFEFNFLFEAGVSFQSLKRLQLLSQVFFKLTKFCEFGHENLRFGGC